jgi:RNA polymerase sigma-70 factor (ECF subfamily)
MNLPETTTESIWRELSNRLRQFVRSRVQSESDVDDILQLVFLRIHEKLDSLRQVDRLESWVFQITRNAIVDHYRSQTPSLPQDDKAPAPMLPPVDEGNFNSEIAGCISALVDRLPEKQRRAVTMYEFDGISQAQVAERESISLSGAKSRIQRGRQALVEILHECCKFEIDQRGNVIGVEANGKNNCNSDSSNECC